MYTYPDGRALKLGDIVALGSISRTTVVAIVDSAQLASAAYIRLLGLGSGVVVEEDDGETLYHLLEPTLDLTFDCRAL